MSTHFVAHLKIERVDIESTGGRSMPGDTKRNVSEVTQLTIKADTLAGLTKKLGAHIRIIEED